MLAKIEARILTFPDTNFNFPSTSVPRGTFLGPGWHRVDKADCRQPWQTICTIAFTFGNWRL